MDDTKVENLDIQKVMDDSGISRAGYSNMFKAVKSKLKEKKISSTLLPIPTQVRKSRRDLNEEVATFLGPSIHIRADFQSGNRKVNFNDSNNIFFDLQTLQKHMVKFYNISQCEVESKLIFVLKLDECEILKQKKTERITITLMNRALDQKPPLNQDNQIDKKHPNYFSAQSKNHIWWLGLFEVCKL